MTVSIESAMRSRLYSEYDMPSVPIEIPSDTPMVLNRIPTRPASTTPCLILCASPSRCMLQGLPSYQHAAILIWGVSRSERRSPVDQQHGLRCTLALGLGDPRRVGVEHDGSFSRCTIVVCAV
jgi:hypothetical protein